MRDEIVIGSITLVTEECYSCHVVFAMPKEMKDRLRADHSRSFYCPAGHAQHYTGKTDLQRTREDLERAHNRQTELIKERDRTKRRLAAAKGQATKLRNRLAEMDGSGSTR